MILDSIHAMQKCAKCIYKYMEDYQRFGLFYELNFMAQKIPYLALNHNHSPQVF